jgi:Spy/CpxP family protein refolding chaperone
MTKFVVILGFLVSFAAGLIVGASRTRTAPPPTVAVPPTTLPAATQPTTRPSRHSFFVRELNLTPEQQEQLKQIWSETADRARKEHEERRRQLRRERDEAIDELLEKEDAKGRYTRIHQRYEEKSRELEREMRAGFERAVERTNAMLTPEQREKYAEILRRQRWDRDGRDGDRDGRGGGPGRRGDDRPASRPATQTST